MARLILIVATLGVIALLIGAGVTLHWNKQMQQPLNISADASRYQLKAGTPVRRLARDLADKGIIESAWAFEWRARRLQLTGQFQAGEYQLSRTLTGEQLMQQFVLGEVYLNHFTIVEGWTYLQLLEQIKQAPGISDPLPEQLSDEELMSALGFPGLHPEGRFLPETYRYPSGTSAVQFLKRAAHALADELTLIWSQRDEDLPLNSAHEALVLASIIERETAVAEERTQISGVLIRRLKTGMRLQVDPTVIYGLGDKFDGNLTRRHLTTDTVYNTYTRSGLPPTPIALASRAAIEASVHPEAGETFYYVSRGDGTHQFSVTYEQHLNAVKKYQLVKRP